jgi:phosphatidylglycerophosphate synthase
MNAENRRPIQARSLSVIQNLASWLARTSITPNQISCLSVVCSLLVPLAFYFFEAGTFAASLLAISGIQLRLLCNLLDGMVAIEGAKRSPLGDIYNEFPDRIADTTILVGVFAAKASDPWLLSFCLAAALLAILTAYTRVLGAAVGTKHYFAGPMAKQHRMALLTFLLFALPFTQAWIDSAVMLKSCMLVISLGCIVTVIRRIRMVGAERVQR